MRILHVFYKMDRGGAESYIMNVFREIDRSQVMFDFVVHSSDKGAFDDEIAALGGRIFYMPKFKGYNIASYKKSFKNILKQNNYDIVHGHMQSIAAIYLKVCKALGIKTVSHSHNTSSGSGLKAVVKNVLQRNVGKYSDVRLACADDAGKWLYGDKFSYHVVANGIDVKSFCYSESVRAQKREELGYNDNDFVIGHAGRFHSQKNHKFLVEIFAEYKKTNPLAKLLLIGGGDDITLIEDYVEGLNLTGDVKFAGVRKDLCSLYSAMDFFVFPSIYEGLGIVLIEAQSAGLMSLVSSVVPKECKLCDLIEFVSLNEPAAFWSNKISSEKLERKKYNAIVADTNFSIEKAAKQLLELYRL